MRFLIFILTILLFNSFNTIFAQIIKNFEVLPDNNYTFQEVKNTYKKDFFSYKRNIPLKKEAYWVRFVVKNDKPYSKEICVFAIPIFDNTLFYYNYEKKEWSAIKSGLEIYTGHRRNNVHYGIILKNNSQDTLYIKIKTAPILSQKFQIALGLYIELTKDYDKRENQKKMWWIITISIMLSFFLYNLYIYIVFRDVSYLYYLLIVVSGMVYITGIEYYFNMLWQTRMYQINMVSFGTFYYVEMSSLMSNIGALGVMIGFVYFTKYYLQLRYYLSLWDKWLRVGVWALVALVVVSDGLTFTGIYYLDTIIYQNILILLIILGILSSGILTYRKGYKPAKYFLIANNANIGYKVKKKR